MVQREPAAQLHASIRAKSGHSKLRAERRSFSMSCSDKLFRWIALGVQGTLLKRFIPTPIRFDSIVLGPVHGVSGSHAAAALLRACTTRADYSAALGPATDAASSTDTAAAVPA